MAVEIWESCLTCMHVNMIKYSPHKEICSHAVVCSKIKESKQLLPSKENTNEEDNRSTNSITPDNDWQLNDCDEVTTRATSTTGSC